MFLKVLKIEKGDLIIREIVFRKGLNLVVDETKTINKKESGNNVGKTTVLRLVDFCLGSDGKNIYTDPEFKDKHNNSLVENFLKKEKVVLTLVLIEDINNEDSRVIKIRRNFLSRKEKIQEIDGRNYGNNADFDDKLKELVFGSVQEKPSFRQIVAKNIRDEKNRLTNTIKVLNSFATDEVYEALYLFWLGVSVDNIDAKQKLQQQKKIEEKIQKRLKVSGSLSQIEQSLAVINRTIGELEKKKDNFSINENFNNEFSDLNITKVKINRIATEIGGMEMRKELILESKRELEDDFVNINTEQIKSIYIKAKRFMPDMHSTYEDVLSFHENMLKEKIDFIVQELPSIEERVKILEKQKDLLMNRQKDLSKIFNETNAFGDLQEIILELNKVFEKKGELGELKKLWDESNEQLSKINAGLIEVNQTILSKDLLIKERIEIFNQYFSTLSYRLYGEQFVLSPDNESGVYKLNISSIDGNIGTGKKKGQIAAFDFAYIQFADSLGIKCLHFILHDQIENIHDNQITSLLTEVVNDANCQYIVPVLRDKLPADIDVTEFEVLKLWQNDKLFRIENSKL